jgi:hypothetical protein
MMGTLLVASAALAAEGAAIQPLERPDPKGITVPDLASAPAQRERGDYDEYFYFYKAGVTYDAAFFDLDECRMYALSTPLLVAPPTFVPLGGDALVQSRARSGAAMTQYGVIGAIISSILIAGAEEENIRANTRRCMAYKGYERYGTRRAIWQQIDAGTDAEKTARMALIASGPHPNAEAIEP